MCSADWFNPKQMLKGTFSPKTGFGLDPLNLTGKDKDRGAFSAPGSKGLRDERREERAAQQRYQQQYDAINGPRPGSSSQIPEDEEYRKKELQRKIRLGLVAKTTNTGLLSE